MTGTLAIDRRCRRVRIDRLAGRADHIGSKRSVVQRSCRPQPLDATSCGNPRVFAEQGGRRNGATTCGGPCGGGRAVGDVPSGTLPGRALTGRALTGRAVAGRLNPRPRRDRGADGNAVFFAKRFPGSTLCKENRLSMRVPFSAREPFAARVPFSARVPFAAQLQRGVGAGAVRSATAVKTRASGRSTVRVTLACVPLRPGRLIR